MSPHSPYPYLPRQDDSPLLKGNAGVAFPAWCPSLEDKEGGGYQGCIRTGSGSFLRVVPILQVSPLDITALQGAQCWAPR